MRVPNAYEEGCCHAPSHIPGRKPLQTSRPDRWTRASLVNRSGRHNSFGHLVDGLRLRLRGIVDPLADGTGRPPASCLAGRPGAEKISPRTSQQGEPLPEVATIWRRYENKKAPLTRPAAKAHSPNV